MTTPATTLEGKRAIVTGAASGIGAAVARRFAAEGARVALLDVDEASARDTASRADTSRCRVFSCDVSDEAAVRRACREACDWMGGLTTLVHAAGVLRYCDAQDFSVEDWHFIMDVNALGTFLVNRTVFPYLRDAGGSIVNVGSLSGVRGHPRNAIYAASKGAVMAWTRTVAAEWGVYGIRVNALAPVAQTPMSDVPNGSPGRQAAIKAGLMQTIPLRRIGDPDCDIAPAVVFLASEASRYITGQVIAVDGGSMMVGS